MEFDKLTPDFILHAAEEQGFHTTGILYPLNSYENRVYEIDVANSRKIVGKFYRPGRWPLAAIVEEHDFVSRLAHAGLSVVAPFVLPYPMPEAKTLACSQNMIMAFYPRITGTQHADYSATELKALGTFLAQLHETGARFECTQRPPLDPDSYGFSQLDVIFSLPFIPDDLRAALEATLTRAVEMTIPYFQNEWEYVTVHGDFHAGNVLWQAGTPHVVDFDDMLEAPPVQDVWMLLNGSSEEKKLQADAFFSAYEKIRPFDRDSLVLCEPLRSLRLTRHAAWIGGRYAEPAFQRAFPYFTQRRFWEEYLLTMKEQVGILQEMF